MMIRLLALLLWLTTPVSVSAFGIVNNSGSSSEDSVCFALHSLDSLGCPVAADSFFVTVLGPGGTAVFTEGINSASSRLVSSSIGGFPVYSYRAAVSDIDGPGSSGTYSVSVVAKSLSLGLLTPNTGSFQLTGWELDDIGDSTGIAARNSRLALDSLHLVIDSLKAALDTLQSQDDWVSAFDFTDDTVLTDIACPGAGDGAYTTTIVAFDTSTSQTVPGASVTIRSVDQSSLIGGAATDASGESSFNLNADDYVAIATATGYLFATYDTITILGEGVDTVLAARFDPGTPSSPSLCRVYGYLFTVDGQPEAGATIAAHLPRGASQISGVIVSPFPISTTSNEAGYFYLDLIPSTSLSGNSTEYEFTITRTDGSILRRRVSIPSGSSWQFTW